MGGLEKLSLFACLLFACAHSPPAVQRDPSLLPTPIEMAITVDDLPRHGPAIEGRGPVEITTRMLEALRKHGVPDVYGFINAGRLREHPEDRAVLDAWISAGYPLGNHTLNHIDLHKTSVDAYIAEIHSNEALLDELQRGRVKTWKVFRYPYLNEGRDVPTAERVREELARSGYRIAPVTVDPFDWAYSPAYARCLEAKQPRESEALRKAFLSEARARLRWSDAEARSLFNRPIKHVLLLHLGLIDADTLDAMLSDYERLGVRWITLDNALTDPVYAKLPVVPDEGQFIYQTLETRRLRAPPAAFTPSALIETMCQPKLSPES